MILKDENVQLNGNDVRAIVVLSQMNLHIWHNESNYRKGIKDGNNLELTHGLNGIRNTAKNIIQEQAGGRKDYKIDCLAAEFADWEITYTNRSTGTVDIKLTDTHTAAFTKHELFYDVQLTEPSGDKFQYLKGTLYITEGASSSVHRIKLQFHKFLM